MENRSQSHDAQDALVKIKTAIERIEAASAKIAETPAPGASSAKVTALVNKHEAMREEVAVTMRELDTIISKLEI